MALNSLRGTYQLYKHDTDVVASWLASTAKAFGYTATSEASRAPQAPAKSTRLKGKDRKRAKEAQARADFATADPLRKEKYAIAIKDFKPLAEFIAGLGDAVVQVPDTFALALERVILIRSSFAEKLAAARIFVDEESNARHQFFVDVLKTVRDTLQPLIDAGTFTVVELKNAVKNIQAPARKESPLNNLFEVLDVYEPSADFLRAPDIATTKPGQNEYTIKPEQDFLFEALFAMTTLMGDLTRLRTEVGDLWKKFDAGEIDIAAAAVATNSAIELARNYEDQMKHLFESTGGVADFHHRYIIQVCAAVGVTYLDKSYPRDDYNYEHAYDLSDTLFGNSLLSLVVFVSCNSLKSKDKVISYSGKWGWYNEASTQADPSNREKYLQDKAALQEALQDMVQLGISSRPGPVQDQLLRGVLSVMKENDQHPRSPPAIPISLSFAAQVYLDILRTVKVGRGWDDLKATYHGISPVVYAHSVACKSLTKQFREMEQTLETDPIALIRHGLADVAGDGRPRYQPYTFYRRNPLYCGMWVNNTRAEFHHHGLQYAATPGAMMYTVQLYHALQQEKLLDAKWEDIETVWKMQGNSAFFIGEELPKTFESYFNNCCLSMGASLTNWAANPRQGKQKLKQSKAGIRELWHKGATSGIMANRVSWGGDARTLDAETLQDFLAKGRKRMDHHSIEKLQDLDDEKKSLVVRLARTVQAEVSDLTFDYFAIHDTCWELLEALKSTLDSLTDSEFSRMYEKQKYTLPFVVGFIFATAAGRSAPNVCEVPSQRLLLASAETAREFVKKKIHRET